MSARLLLRGELPAVGGRLEAHPEDFVVEELPLYPASGEGEHAFARLRRAGWTSDAVVGELARRLRLAPREIGLAGRKDKHALATQTFSLPWPLARPLEELRAALASADFELLALARHGNKLRLGQHAGNRFRVRLRGVAPDAASRARAIEARLRERGFANAFGAQRYGADGANAERGLALLRRGSRPRDARERLMLSAWQSERFDRWLALRLERGLFARLLPGDLAQRAGGRATFVVEDLGAEQARLDAGEISFTGPLFGHEAPRARAEAGALEAELLAESGVDERALRRARLPGARRTARLACPPLELVEEPDALVLLFTLPPGAYATSLLEELCGEDSQAGAAYTDAPAWLRPRQERTGDARPAAGPDARARARDDGCGGSPSSSSSSSQRSSSSS